MFDYVQQSMSILNDFMPRGIRRPKRLDEGDLNRWILNEVMAPNPAIRYLTSLMYLSKFNGLSRINYPDSEFMRKIRFDQLSEQGKPLIFHNAWNLDTQELAFFANHRLARPKNGEFKGPITAQSLCACSALPFVEETVEI